MKKMLFLFVTFVATNLYATCPNISGQYFDQFSFYNEITQIGCEKLIWKLDNNPGSPDFELGLPKFKEIIADSKDHTEWNGGMQVTYFAYFAETELVVSWEKSFYYNEEWVSNYSREVYKLSREGTVLKQFEKDLKDEKEFRNRVIDSSFHREYTYSRRK